MREIRILLVEDNFPKNALDKRILKGWHCNVEIITDTAIAVERVENGVFDIVLMNIRSEEADIYKMAKGIRNLALPKCYIPIVAITANASIRESNKYMEVDIDEYIAKPFSEQKLYTKLANVLAKKAAAVGHQCNQETGMNKCTDLAYLREFSNGDIKFMIEMIQVFLKQAPLDIVKMKAFLQAENWDSLGAVVHKMKPSVTFMGIHQLKNIIALIEDYIEKGSMFHAIPGLAQEVEIILNKAIKELEIELKNL